MKKILLLMCFVSTVLFAQENNNGAAKVWTLKECIDYALANNLNVQRSQYNVESAEINNTQAKMGLLPTLNASASNGFNFGRSINFVTYQYTTKQFSSLNPSINTSVTLFNGLRLQSLVKQNSRDLLASEEDLSKAKNDVSLNVVNLYINVIFNRELHEVAKFQLSSSQQQLDRTTKQVEAGALPKSNQLNLEAQVATNELSVINTENALNLSILQLKQALQIPASTQMDVETPEISVEDLVIDQSSETVFNIARQTMPEIRSAEMKKRSSYYAVKAAKGNLFPRLSLNGGMNSNYSSANDVSRLIPDGGFDIQPSNRAIGFYDNGGTSVPVFGYNYVATGAMSNGYGYHDQLKDNLSKSISLSLTVPLFNGLQAKSAVKRAIVNQHLTEISAKEVNNTLRQNVESAFNDANAASKSYNASLRQVQAREEAYRMTQQRYNIGAANYVEYQVAENDLFQAKSDLTRAKYNFIFRKKLLDFYQGKPLGF
jgi:outer membrane protein